MDRRQKGICFVMVNFKLPFFLHIIYKRRMKVIFLQPLYPLSPRAGERSVWAVSEFIGWQGEASGMGQISCWFRRVRYINPSPFFYIYIYYLLLVACLQQMLNIALFPFTTSIRWIDRNALGVYSMEWIGSDVSCVNAFAVHTEWHSTGITIFFCVGMHLVASTYSLILFFFAQIERKRHLGKRGFSCMQEEYEF